MIFWVILIYACALIAANLLVSKFGPSITPINAFVLIGFDLAIRDWLHFRLKKWQMGALILATGAITCLLNPATGMIAIASVFAFVTASTVDWIVFSKTSGSWVKRSNFSNLASAAIDSILFPTIAFGALIPNVVGMQFAAKVVGAAIWSVVIYKIMLNSTSTNHNKE